MKKQILSLILAGFLQLSFFTLAQSNNYPVTTIKGVEYYQYTVQPSEGLLSIGRKFKLTTDEIIKASPEVKDGLKVGQLILIPIPKKSDKKSLNQKTSLKEFEQYKVEKKQTLYSISRKFDVSEEDIIKFNPEIKNGLKEGIILQIPKPLKENKKQETDKSIHPKTNSLRTDKNTRISKYTTHKVLANETLFSISRRYKVDILDIIHLNPGSDTKMVIGSELKIPILENSKTKEIKKDSELISSKATKAETKNVEKSIQSKFSEKKNIKIAFLLPLMLDQPKSDQSVERFINYYEGSLLAINEAKQRGISFEIYTYDTEKTEERVTEILNNPELKTVDLIIGPAFSNQVPFVEKFAKENKINTLIPFTSKVPDIDSNPYLFQFNPGQDSELDFFSDLIIGKYKNTHILFAEIQDISPLDEGKIGVDVLQKKMIKEHRNFSKIELTSSDNVDFTGYLKKGEKNLIIFNTDKFSNVSPFMNSITSKLALFDITLYKQYNWRNQSDKTLQSIFISPFITNFNPKSINDFNLQFDQYFGKEESTDSPRFDLLGYDLSNYFISLIQRNGSKFGTKINSTNLIKGIQSEPLFERDSNNSGFINQRVYLGEDKAE